MASAPQYCSAINAVYTDLNLPPPAVGPLVNQVRTGLHRLQIDTKPPARERPLPGAVIGRMMEMVRQMLNRRQPFDLCDLRALLFCVVAYVTASRPVSIVALPVADMLVQRTGDIVIYRRFTKTVQVDAPSAPGRVPLTLPASHFATLRAQLRHFDRHRQSDCQDARFFFQLQRDKFDLAHPASNGGLAQPWLARALKLVNMAPPDGETWTPRSLRSGGASAAEALGVTRSKIEYLGGWAPGSTALAKHYIDPTYVVDGAMHACFGYLLPVSAGANTMATRRSR